MTPISTRLIVVSAPQGAKMDFVASWLHGLESHVLSGRDHDIPYRGWSLDPLTRKSLVNFAINLRQLGDPLSLTDILKNCNFDLSPDSVNFVVGVSHGVIHGLLRKNTISIPSTCMTPEQQKCTTFVQITTDDLPTETQLRICWNAVVKVFFYHNTPFHIQHMTDEQKVQYIKSLLDYIKNKTEYFIPPLEYKNDAELDFLSVIKIPYDKLLIPGGSRLLVEQLKLQYSVPEFYHEYWDLMLSHSDAPETVEKFGVTWQLLDLLKRPGRLSQSLKQP
jgi:hypothetical protein